jgi:hypothetical protein
MTTIHSLLHLSNNTFEDVNEIVEKLVLYGPSTGNKKSGGVNFITAWKVILKSN